MDDSSILGVKATDSPVIEVPASQSPVTEDPSVGDSPRCLNLRWLNLVSDVFVIWSDGLKSGLLSSEDVEILKRNLEEKDSKVFPTADDEWISLHSSFGLVCWCDDEKLADEFEDLKLINFFRLCELTDEEKEMLQVKVSVLMKTLAIPALSEVVTREAVYYGIVDNYMKVKIKRLNGHRDMIGATSWNGHILTSGSGRAILNHDENTKKEANDIVPYYKLFTFADSTDYMLMVIGTVTAIGSGIAMPLQTLIFGELVDTFGENAESKTIVHQVSKVSLNKGLVLLVLRQMHRFVGWNGTGIIRR